MMLMLLLLLKPLLHLIYIVPQTQFTRRLIIMSILHNHSDLYPRLHLLSSDRSYLVKQ